MPTSTPACAGAKEEVSVLFEVTGYIRIAAVVLVALLTFIAFIFINNTIRLSITARRREIAIMRLVGASNGFIRGPFVTEGVIQAILGAILAVGALELMRNILVPTAQAALGSLFNITIPLDVYLATYGALALVGVGDRPLWLGHRDASLPQGVAGLAS